MAVLCLSAGFWSVCEGLLYMGFAQGVDYRLTQLQYLGIVATTPALIMFIITLFDLRSSKPAVLKTLLCVPSVAMLAMAWTNDAHRLVWPRVWTITDAAVPMLGVSHGPAYWVWLAYTYAILCTVTVILVLKARDAAGRLKAQATALLLAV